jgi:hypothetical protein
MSSPTTSSCPDRDFVEYIIKQLVDFPDKVQATRTVDDLGVLISLEVAPEDMPRIIGKNGQTIQSLRILLRVVGAKNNARVNLKVIEPEGGLRYQEMQNKPTEAPAGEESLF